MPTNKLQKKLQTYQAYSFAKKYYNSPGFEERFKKVPEYIEQYNNNPIYDREEVHPSQIEKKPFDTKIIFKDDETSGYKGGDVNVVTVGEDYYAPYFLSLLNPWLFPAFDYGANAAHEHGHAIENHIKLNHKPEESNEYIPDEVEYSQIFPHFRNSKAYQRERKRHWANSDHYERYPHSEWYYNTNPDSHDGAPTESYADLMAFREALYRHKIYDSTKANNPFTKEHLNEWKKLRKHLRLFSNFTDEQIIQMMNDIAQNNMESSNPIYYAKNGIKIIPRKFRSIK